MTQGSEWATEGWASIGGDRWKMSDSVGALVRLRMKGLKVLPSPRGDWDAVITDVDVIDPDGKGYATHGDVALGNAWVLGTFRDHLPYSAVGVVETFAGKSGQGYQLRAATEEELAKVAKALDLPAF